MKFVTHRNVKRVLAATVVGAAAAATMLGTGGAAHAATTSSRTVTPASCENLPAQIDANGVRIHAKASTSSRTVGLAYKGQTFVICSAKGTGNLQWDYGKDKHTGVWGWIRGNYFN